MDSKAAQLRKSITDWVQVVLAVSVVSFLVMYIRSIRAAGQTTPPPVLIHVPVVVAIGEHPAWYSRPVALYTLVEFADYQCPPCKLAMPDVCKLADSNRGKLRFTFRNYPLHSLHPRADAAAVAAEIARLNDKFWQVHDALYRDQIDLSERAINSVLKQAGVNTPPSPSVSKSASAVVAKDIADGDKCGVHGTPTFILCLPDGSVYRLGSLSQAADFIK